MRSKLDVNERRTRNEGAGRRILLRSVVSMSVFLMSSHAAGAGGEALSISDALDIALRQNPELMAERYRQKATDETALQAALRVMPVISGQASLGHQQNNQTVNSELFGVTRSQERDFNLDPMSASISAEQVLFDGQQNINGIKQATARRAAGMAALLAVEQDILLRTATAYVSILQDKRIERANRVTVDTHIGELKRAEARFESGEGTVTDIRQAQARLAAMRARHATALTNLAASREQLKELIGDIHLDLTLAVAQPKIPTSLEETLTLAINQAPKIIEARRSLEAAEFMRAGAKGAFSPTISAYVSYRYSDQPSAFTVKDEEVAYGVRAQIPIFQGGLRFSKVREVSALASRDRARLNVAERQIRSRVSILWRRIEEAQINVLAAEEQLSAGNLALEGVRAETRSGLRTMLDVLDAENERAQADIALARAERDLITAKVSLLAEIGALSPAGLGRAPSTDHSDD